MPLILVVDPDARLSARVRSLADDGWRIVDAADLTTAMEATAAEPPDLYLVATEAAGADELIGPLARRRGGPGTIAVAGSGEAGPEALADAVLGADFDQAALRDAVARVLAASARVGDGGPAGDKLTSQDIFGDLVAELEAEDEPLASAPPPAAPRPLTKPAPEPPRRERSQEDLDSRLEKTLAGLLDPTAPTAPAAPASRAGREAAEHRKRAPRDDVDALLDRTLAGLDLPRRPSARRPPPPTPPAGSPEPPIADAPADPDPVQASEEPLGPLEPLDALEGLEPLDLYEPEEQEPEVAAGEAEPPPAAGEVAAVDAADEDDEEGTPFGQYRLLERIGVGGMAEVWKARMEGVEGFRKTVAIKKILPHLTDSSEFVDMFVDEAKLAAQLNHPNIIHIYDLGKIDHTFYIAMEHVEGENLRKVLDRAREEGRALPPAIALHVGARLARALDHAHRRRDFDDRALGLVHRDVSPQNVLLSRDGDIKLCDFGIAKAAAKSSHTQMGALKGKIQYMSPEQAWGRPVDARSDIFGLGVLLFEMLSGDRLFDGDSEVAILDAVREVRLRPLVRPDGPESTAERAAVADLVERCLAAEPDDRFATAGELADRLEAVAARYRPVPGPAEVAAYLASLFDDRPVPEFVYLDEPEAAGAEPEAAADPEAGAPEPAPREELEPTAAGGEGASPFLEDQPAVEPPLPLEPPPLEPPPLEPIPFEPMPLEPDPIDEPERVDLADADAIAEPAGPAEEVAPVGPAYETAPLDPTAGPFDEADAEGEDQPATKRRTGLLVAGLVAILALAALLVWLFVLRDGPAWLERPASPAPAEDAAPAAQAPPPAELPLEPATPEVEDAGATGAAGSVDGGEAAVGDAAVDIEQLVDQELARREAELRRQFEEQLAREEQPLRRRLQELEEAAEPPVDSPADPPRRP